HIIADSVAALVGARDLQLRQAAAFGARGSHQSPSFIAAMHFAAASSTNGESRAGFLNSASAGAAPGGAVVPTAPASSRSTCRSVFQPCERARAAKKPT